MHKCGNTDQAVNYRPICVTFAVGKIVKSMANFAVIQHLTQNKLLSPCQHGFHSARSVETNLIDAYEYVTELVDNGFLVDMILLDLAKAFDKVLKWCAKSGVAK